MNYKIEYFEKHKDYKGDLVVFLKSTDLPFKYKRFGQIYFVTFKKKGIKRGNHYHKKWSEWFGIVSGKVEVCLEDVKSREKRKFIFNGKDKVYLRLRIGPNIAHKLTSLTKYASVLNYTDKEWNPNDTYRYRLNV